MMVIEFLLILCSILLSDAKIVWCAPGKAAGSADGSSKANAHGDFAGAQTLLSPGDTLRVVDGTYSTTFEVKVSGTSGKPITFEAETRGGVTVDVNKKLANAFVVLNRKFVTIDGFRLGDATSYSFHALNNADLTVRNCGCFDAGSTEAACNADYNNCFSNTHCFEFAYSERVLLEDSWSWGVARYNAVLYQTNDSIIRRFACKGSVWHQLPHACLTSYCNQRSLIENAVVTGIRLSKDSPAGNPFAFVHGGFVSDAHDCGVYTPAHKNRLHGVISIDNGSPRTGATPRLDASPYQFLVMSQNGWDEFDDIVAWSSDGQGDFFITLTSGITPPSYWNGPTRYIQRTGRYPQCTSGLATNCPPGNMKINTNPRLQNRFVNGVYTSQSLWPWPNEDLIKADFGWNETITEFVKRTLAGEVTINTDPSAPTPSTAKATTTTAKATTTSTTATVTTAKTTTQSTAKQTTTIVADTKQATTTTLMMTDQPTTPTATIADTTSVTMTKMISVDDSTTQLPVTTSTVKRGCNGCPCRSTTDECDVYLTCRRSDLYSVCQKDTMKVYPTFASNDAGCAAMPQLGCQCKVDVDCKMTGLVCSPNLMLCDYPSCNKGDNGCACGGDGTQCFQGICASGTCFPNDSRETTAATESNVSGSTTTIIAVQFASQFVLCLLLLAISILMM